ncbi:DoxX family protein [Chryseosolibacter indicus]|uniref:DoxX family protein n=1 Tax=Chryseosolibacter indicus TaxID=2782351 RepID=A0ABS5VKU0_9BACT|nr:DoxX family protein [Chryseosolibacter indicus]MBT1701991.1 DoxX family protein [Chryseosolibacter indicus]
MAFYHQLNLFFDKRKDYGAIFLRLIIGWRLIDGTQDNILSWHRMIEFKDFLQQHGVSYPLMAAWVSVYAQFICGSLYILGYLTRLAAIIMIINFLVALWLVHIGTTFQQSFDALMMLFGSVFFLYYGAGKLSIDNLLVMQKKN